MKKIIILIFFVGLFFTACNDEKKSQEKLRVGMELAYPPFEMTDSKGVPSGVSVEFAKELGKYLNKKVEIVNCSWDGLIPSLKTNKIDLIISSMTVTEARKKTINFSIPYAKSSLAILANNKSNVFSISDLNKKNKIIAVKRGSTGHLYAINNLKNAKISVFDKENSCVLEVVQGRADGFLYDQLTIYKNYIQHKNTTKAILKSFQKESEYWAVAIRKNDLLEEKINNFIKKAKTDGTFDKIINKYLKDVKETFDKLNIEFFF